MAKVDRTARRARVAPLLLLLLLALAAATACEDRTPTNLVTQTPSALRRVIGVAEVTFHDLNTPAISATVRLATNIADLEQLRANPAAPNSLTTIKLDLITPANSCMHRQGARHAQHPRNVRSEQNANGHARVRSGARESRVRSGADAANGLRDADSRAAGGEWDLGR